MATAVLDIDVETPPLSIGGLSAYSQALALLRLRGLPIGHVRLWVQDGQIKQADIRDAIVQQAAWPVWERRVHEWLAWDKEATTAPAPRATIAICTRDRPDDIRRCLAALAALPDDGQEVLVIDNAPSTDATRRIAQEYPAVRYVCEPRPGLNNARNRAMREARHEVVAFIDDDATPDRLWLKGLVRSFDDPLVACVTGLTMPLELETDAQEMHERWSPFGRGYARLVFEGAHFDPMAAGQVGAGVNMALRRSCFEALGPFDPVLDAGTVTRSGGDTEMFARILNRGFRIVYEPNALCWHRHRRTWKELRKMIFGYGAGAYAAWTSLLLSERQLGMVKPALLWMFGHQLPTVFRSLRWWHRNAPLDLAVAEVAGCVAGPWLYFASRRRARLQDAAS